MKHAILGVGAIGGLMGTTLGALGEDVTLIVRLEKLEDYPKLLILEQPNGTVTAPAKPVSRLETPVDVLWISTKTYQMQTALSSIDVDLARLRLHAQRALQHDGELVELGLLTGLNPSLRTAHVGDADRSVFGVYAADIFVNELGLVAGGGDARRLRDESGRHASDYKSRAYLNLSPSCKRLAEINVQP